MQIIEKEREYVGNEYGQQGYRYGKEFSFSYGELFQTRSLKSQPLEKNQALTSSQALPNILGRLALHGCKIATLP